MTTETLTHSSSSTFKTCRKQYEYAYQLGIRRSVDGKPLRMGSAFHVGLDSLKQGKSLDDAVEVARACYDTMPAEYEPTEWEIERETVAGLLSGYNWRWKEQPFKVLATEQAFHLPLINPETGAPSTVFELAGKIDGIIELEDKRLAVLEHKLLSDTIDAGSDFWRRYQMDSQVSLYTYAARKLGYDVSTCIVDVARKPTIKPTNVPLLDADGLKVVLDANGERVRNAGGKAPKKPSKNCRSCFGSGAVTVGNESQPCPCTLGTWRQTADTEKGYSIVSRPMTTEEWVGKLLEDIGERPEWYYCRMEIPRLDDDLLEFQIELWEVQQTVRAAQRMGRWFKTVNYATCPRCAYFSLCSSKFNAETDSLPEGFVRIDDKHPELSGVADG